MTSADVATSVKNTGVLEVVAAAAKYFNNEETLTEILEKQRENWFYLPLTTVTRAFTFDDFITHIRRASRTEKWAPARCVTTSIPKGGLVLKCGSGFIGNTKKLIAEPLVMEGPPMSPKVERSGGDGVVVGGVPTPHHYHLKQWRGWGWETTLSFHLPNFSILSRFRRGVSMHY
jgi:hypothetical protein